MESSHAAVGHNETTGTQNYVRVGAIQHVAILLDSANRVSALNIVLHSIVICHALFSFKGTTNRNATQESFWRSK